MSVEHVGDDAARDWVGLPTSRAPRWYLSASGGVAASALSVYRPVALKAHAAWWLARASAHAGVFRVFPRIRIPDEVQAALMRLPVAGEIAAVSKANHSRRWIALVLSPTGSHCIAKIALDEEGAARLDSEHEKLRQLGGLLPLPLLAPRVIHYQPGSLILEAVMSRPRLSPSVMPAEVASSLGGFFASMGGGRSAANSGPSHGDCAPWNLLRRDGYWVFIDWESAATDQPPFRDVIHYHVQSYVQLGRPSLRSLVAGFEGAGGIATAIRAYADRTGHPPHDAHGYFRDYVMSAPLLFDPKGGRECRPRARRRAQQLLASMGQ